MLLSGLVHIHTDRRAEWESDRDRKRKGEREGEGVADCRYICIYTCSRR